MRACDVTFEGWYWFRAKPDDRWEMCLVTYEKLYDSTDDGNRSFLLNFFWPPKRVSLMRCDRDGVDSLQFKQAEFRRADPPEGQ